MEFNKIKIGMKVNYKRMTGSVIATVRPENTAWVKVKENVLKVPVQELKKYSQRVEPKLSSIIPDIQEQERFKRELERVFRAEREDGKPLNHKTEYTKEECAKILYEFIDLVTSSGHISDLSEWVEKCYSMAKLLKRTVLAISTEASRIHFAYGKPTPVIKKVIEEEGLVRIIPAKKTTKVLRYMVHNGN